MALTPDTPNEAFLREVDENYRRDRMQEFAKRYGAWLIAAVVLFLAAIGGWLYWQERQREKAAEQSEELMSIYTDLGAGNTAQASKRLQPLETADNEVTRALAILTQAAIALEGNDRPAALSQYRRLADDQDLPEAYRHLGLIRATALEFDTIKPEEVVARLEPLTRPGNAWFGTAGEMTAMAYLKQGQRDRAARLFAAISKDNQVPETIRNRAAQIAGTLGVDASAPLPQAAQPGTTE